MKETATACTSCFALFLWLTATVARAQYDPPPHPIFEGDAVHAIRLTFHQPDWWDRLVVNFEGVDDPPYLEAEFDWESFHFDSIGVRFKGNSSYYLHPGQKKSFKLDFDELVEDQTIYGLDKLNLNNAHRDPAFVREKCYYELATEMGQPACRTNYAALFINGVYWGLYVIVEQIDSEFIRGRFGVDEEGNLWKGDPRGSFEYLGPDEASYHPFYELKTNEEEDDWSSLVAMIDALNNTPSASLTATMQDLVDLSSAMALVAVDALALNPDGYACRNHNHYAYRRDSDGRFVHINWDANLSWGVSLDEPIVRLLMPEPFADARLHRETHPLTYRLWTQPTIEGLFDSHIRRGMSRGANPDTLLARMEELRDLVRPWVQADTKMDFTPQDFEDAMDRDVPYSSSRPIPGIRKLVYRHHVELLDRLGPYTGRDELALNELMASNGSTLGDGAGDFDDWVELVNRSDHPVSLQGVTLTDDPTIPAAYALPSIALQPGEHYLVWADGEPQEGIDHAPFKLSAGGEGVYLFDGTELLDATTWAGLAVDEVLGRSLDGGGAWIRDLLPTPGAENQRLVGTGELLVNELVASNATGITDEAGEHEDWVELFNPTAADVDATTTPATVRSTRPSSWARRARRSP